MEDERYKSVKGFHIYSPSKVLLYTRELESNTPVFLEVHPSTRCNHKCVWCRYWNMANPNDLTKDELFSLFEKYPQVKGIRISGGGEPLLNKHLMDFIVKAHRRNIKIGLDTNGTLFNEERIRIVGECCQYCRISLDAATEETYKAINGSSDFFKVIRNIHLLSKTQLPELGISYLVSYLNTKDISKISGLGLPVKYIHFKPLIEGITPLEQAAALSRIKRLRVPYQKKYDRIYQDYYFNKAVPCEITKLIRVIGGDGKTYTCCEHAYESEFETSKWNGSTEKCIQCRYNPLNEVLDMYRRNTFTKEFL